VYSRDEIRRIDPGKDASDIDPYTEAERDQIIEYFRAKRPHYFAFVMHQFWTGARPSEAIHLRWKHVDLAGRRILIRGSRVMGEDSRTKTKKSGRDVVIHEPLLIALKAHRPLHPKADDFVFTTVTGATLDEVNFYNREWIAALRSTSVRPRGFYNCRHTYISAMKSLGIDLVFIARQTGTSLEMILKHYGSAKVAAEQLDELIAGRNRNPTGTLRKGTTDQATTADENEAIFQLVGGKAGGRDRTGDVQLGKLTFYH